MAGLDQQLLPIVRALTSAAPLVIAATSGALYGCGLRALLLALCERKRGVLRLVGRLVAAAIFGALGTLYVMFTAAMVDWTLGAAALALFMALLMTSGVLVFQVALKRPSRLSPTAILLRATIVLSLLLLVTLSLMRSGFLALTTDRPVLRIDVTGEVRPQKVRWAAPDQPMQEQELQAHRILLRKPEKPFDIVGETWLYGDQVAVKGRVLRLSPILNAAGVENLFELSFIHNGYFTAERHSAFPHQAQPLAPLGPLAVHPRWRPLRDLLLSNWEHRSANSLSRFAVRGATTESTYFPLLDAQGKPVQHSFELVLTPGGLSAR